jgi:hypothetical protein
MDSEALRLALTKIITELEAIHQLLEKQTAILGESNYTKG